MTVAALIASGRMVEAGWLMTRDGFLAVNPHADELALRAAFFAGANFIFVQFVEAARNNDDGTMLARLRQEFEDFLDMQHLMNAPPAGNA
jgi:hypothetical protein